jgi:branched-chain amino acid transport system ATP-binding protein
VTELLAINRVSIAFGGVQAVRDVSVVVPEGVVFSIIGPNGAGKTTLFNIISGLYVPQSGKIKLRGEDIVGSRPDILARKGLSRTFQNLQIFTQMTAVENVMVGRHIHERTSMFAQLLSLPSVLRENRESFERARQMLEFVGLKNVTNSMAASMPYGALKRLEIARALATNPKIILFDEPAAGCNPTETAEVEALIRKIADTGVTVLLIEHDMKLVMRISDTIHVLDRGETICEGTAAQVQHNERVVGAYLGNHGAREAANA